MWHPCRPDDMDVALMSLPEAGAGDWRGHRGRCGSRDPGMTATAAIEIIRRVGGRRGGDVTRSLPGLRRFGGTGGQLRWELWLRRPSSRWGPRLVARTGR